MSGAADRGLEESKKDDQKLAPQSSSQEEDQLQQRQEQEQQEQEQQRQQREVLEDTAAMAAVMGSLSLEEEEKARATASATTASTEEEREQVQGLILVALGDGRQKGCVVAIAGTRNDYFIRRYMIRRHAPLSARIAHCGYVPRDGGLGGCGAKVKSAERRAPKAGRDRRCLHSLDVLSVPRLRPQQQDPLALRKRQQGRS